jgi:glutamate/aspartate transport system permease protein
LPRGQRAAAFALGLTQLQTYRYVLLPIAFRTILPPLTSEFVSVFKNSAVASTIGLLNLSAQARQLADYTAQTYESLMAVTVTYFAINIVVLQVMRRIEARTRLVGFIGGK